MMALYGTSPTIAVIFRLDVSGGQSSIREIDLACMHFLFLFYVEFVFFYCVLIAYL